MKKILLSVLFTLPCLLFSKEDSFFSKENSHFYGGMQSVGIGGIPFPLVSVGMRTQRGAHGFDLSGSALAIKGYMAELAHLKGRYLFYPRHKGFLLRWRLRSKRN